MGNKHGGLRDEHTLANIGEFDHTFKVTLDSYTEDLLTTDEREVTITFKTEIVEISTTDPRTFANLTLLALSYGNIMELVWDHSTSSFKAMLDRGSRAQGYIILVVENSLELEHELKLRLSNAATSGVRGRKVPPFTYLGMFAGPTKPKPFQRKRPNLTRMQSGKLPPLATMRQIALERHRNAYEPTPPGQSRRLRMALEHIQTGCNAFQLRSVRSDVFRWGPDSQLILDDTHLAYLVTPNGQSYDIPYESISEWNILESSSSLEVISGLTHHSFSVPQIRDIKHTMEFYWNKFCVRNNRPVKRCSTHGRPLEIVYTLHGDSDAPPAPVGSTDLIDFDGSFVRPGARRRSSGSGAALMKTLSQSRTLSENLQIKRHWNKVVKHQGWLLKRGGSTKQWLKRYFVLYSTSQGHFLAYYSDLADMPLFSTSYDTQRNTIDLCKVTFIRPVTNQKDAPDHSFDIQTIEREWTLGAETQASMQKWLQLITRGVDEDVAIIPDDMLYFQVKTRSDPTNTLPKSDYSTLLKVSASGMSVASPAEGQGSLDPNIACERFFWVYTDFYKWSLLTQLGKLALVITVFADEAFTRKEEFMFRTKEAQRLATAIEFYIEKFMSVMHVSLEGEDDSREFIEPPRSPLTPTSPLKMHDFGDDEWGHNHDGNEWASDDGGEDETKQAERRDSIIHDLLDLGIEDTHQTNGNEAPVLSLPIQQPPDLLYDPYSMQPNGTSAATSAPHNPFETGTSTVGYGSTMPTAQPNLLGIPFDTASSAQGSLGFGSVMPSRPVSVFAAATVSASAAPGVTISQNRSLTPEQTHRIHEWYEAIIHTPSTQPRPLFDDGCVQILYLQEFRTSQGRLSFSIRNSSPSPISGFTIALQDGDAMLRAQVSPERVDLLAGASGSICIMCECMKPSMEQQQIIITYAEHNGTVQHVVNLPFTMCSFNEPLMMGPEDFTAHWMQLSSQEGQERVEIFSSALPVSDVRMRLFTALQFGQVLGLPDEGGFAIYGSASLKTGATLPSGEKINVGCLVKVDVNEQASAIRVTVRTIHPLASLALLETLKRQLISTAASLDSVYG